MTGELYFVTGATGLVGQFVVAELLRRGVRVRASYRGRPPTTLASGADVTAIEWVEGDVLDPLFLHGAVAGTDAVLHCAALVSYAPRDAEQLWMVNVTGTANVVDACLAAPSTRLGYVSSVAALGQMPAENAPVTEAARWTADGHVTAYAGSKYAAEVEVWRGISEGLAAVIVNPSVVVGPADPNRSSTQLLKYAAGRHTYYPPGQLNVVDVRDVASALVELLDRPSLLGARYILSAGALSYEAFFRLAAATLDVPPPSRELSTALAEILWRAEAVRGWLTGAAPLLTRETARIGQRSAVFDADCVRVALPFVFREPEDTIRWAAQLLCDRLV